MYHKYKKNLSQKLLLVFVLTLGFGGLITASAIEASASNNGNGNNSFSNPVSEGVADTFPDPAIIRAKDGYWYAYGTTDPTLQSGGDNSFHTLPIMRSEDMVNWEYVDDVFNEDTLPDWVPEQGSNFWAPDIRYMNGKYYLYYSIAHFSDNNFWTIGVATAPTPSGPWTDQGEVIEQGSCNTHGIDAAVFTDDDGTHYFYWGSYGSICGAELSADGTQVVGEVKELTYGGQAEAPYVVKHGEYYYMFISEGGCCSGPVSSYQVYVGRSTNPLGPFVDRNGVSMMDSRRGGTLVMSSNGNKWVGNGHHSIATDLSGQQWIVYHALDKNNPFLEPPHTGINRRPLMIDRLDWIDGWPTVRAGAWASEGNVDGPITKWDVGTDFNNMDNLNQDWLKQGAAKGGWRIANEVDAGGYIHQKAPATKESYLVSRKNGPSDFRAEADVRIPSESDGAVGLVAAYKDEGNHVVAWIDTKQNALITDVIVKGKSKGKKVTPLHDDFDYNNWHNVAIEMRNLTMKVEVTDARLGDPLASQTRSIAQDVNNKGSVGVTSISARVDADNVGITKLYDPVKEKVSDPTVGEIDPEYSDNFDDGILDSLWSWVRTPIGEETSGGYRMETQNLDLHMDRNDASVLLRDVPDGAYTVETKLTMDLGINTDLGFNQAGLVVYADDDEYLKLVHSAVGTSRRTEFAKESDGYGGMMVGPPADTTWLRIQHTVDPENGEHEYRAATSRDGQNWYWGGVWTMPAHTQTKIGLVAQSGLGSIAEFDYVHIYRP